MNRHRISVPGDECQSIVAFSSGRSVSRHVASGRRVPGHISTGRGVSRHVASGRRLPTAYVYRTRSVRAYAFQTQRVKAYFYQTTSARAFAFWTQCVSSKRRVSRQMASRRRVPRHHASLRCCHGTEHHSETFNLSIRILGCRSGGSRCSDSIQLYSLYLTYIYILRHIEHPASYLSHPGSSGMTRTVYRQEVYAARSWGASERLVLARTIRSVYAGVPAP
jgi:hypothetical protein